MVKSIMELVGGAFQDFTDAELRTVRDVFDLSPQKLRVVVFLGESYNGHYTWLAPMKLGFDYPFLHCYTIFALHYRHPPPSLHSSKDQSSGLRILR